MILGLPFIYNYALIASTPRHRLVVRRPLPLAGLRKSVHLSVDVALMSPRSHVVILLSTQVRPKPWFNTRFNTRTRTPPPVHEGRQSSSSTYARNHGTNSPSSRPASTSAHNRVSFAPVTPSAAAPPSALPADNSGLIPSCDGKSPPGCISQRLFFFLWDHS